jgi:cephalosporin hydroxylase
MWDFKYFFSGLFKAKDKKTMRYEKINGWFDWHELYDLAAKRAIINENNEEDCIDTLVEIGVYKGRSLCYLLEKLEEYGKLGKVNVFGIDNFSYDSSLQEVEENLSFAKGKYHIHPVKRDVAAEWIPDESCSMIMVDGDHSYQECLNDCHWAWRKLRCGGLLLVHDYENPSCPEVEPAVNKFLSEKVVDLGTDAEVFASVFKQQEGIKIATFKKVMPGQSWTSFMNNTTIDDLIEKGMCKNCACEKSLISSIVESIKSKKRRGTT